LVKVSVKVSVLQVCEDDLVYSCLVFVPKLTSVVPDTVLQFHFEFGVHCPCFKVRLFAVPIMKEAAGSKWLGWRENPALRGRRGGEGYTDRQIIVVEKSAKLSWFPGSPFPCSLERVSVPLGLLHTPGPLSLAAYLRLGFLPHETQTGLWFRTR
jgi:hypothetical protein